NFCFYPKLILRTAKVDRLFLIIKGFGKKVCRNPASGAIQPLVRGWALIFLRESPQYRCNKGWFGLRNPNRCRPPTTTPPDGRFRQKRCPSVQWACTPLLQCRLPHRR